MAKVDDEDHQWLLGFRWKRVPGKRTSYAATCGKGSQRMHRMILERYGLLSADRIVDHEDRDGLNNQKDNLRPCNHGQNGVNFTKNSSGRSSQFKGVTFHKTGTWYARLKVEQQYRCIGTFDCERDAAIAYDIEAKCCFGEFATLNVPDVSDEDRRRVQALIDNPKRCRGTTSSYLGVFRRKRTGRWGFNAFYGGKNHQETKFDSALEAAKARDVYISKTGLRITKSL